MSINNLNTYINKSKISRIVVSVVTAFLYLLVAYLVMNLSFTIPSSFEKPKLKILENIKSLSRRSITSEWEDSIICIDVSHDQVITMEYDSEGNAIGEIPVCDHEKLFQLLQSLHNNNNYRYILLDILFDRYIRQPIDSQLYNLISEMPNIVIPLPMDSIADSCLLRKACMALYTAPNWDKGFTKYPILQDGKPSIPLRMYEELSGNIFSEPLHKLWWDKGLARNSIYLTYKMKDNDNKILSLGRCLGYPINGIRMRARLNNPALTDGKYIVIGDFKNDRHETFLGLMSGPMVNMNAFVALIYHHHRISSIILIFALLLLSILCYIIIYGLWFNRLLGGIINNIKTITLLLGILCLITYVFSNMVFDIFIFIILFYSLQIAVEFDYGHRLFPTSLYILILIVTIMALSWISENHIAYPLLLIALSLPFIKVIKDIIPLITFKNR